MAVRSVSGAGHLRQTGRVLSGTVRRRDGVTVFVGATLAYLVVYLAAIGNVAFGTGTGVGVAVPVEDPLSHAFRSAPGRFAYEPIAVVDFGFGTYFVSPINTGIGLLIAALVGANLAVSYLALVQPRSCGISAGAGVLSAVPALLAGGACCAPVILIVTGVTAGATVLAVLDWLLPIGFCLLVLSLVYLAHRVEPTALSG